MFKKLKIFIFTTLVTTLKVKSEIKTINDDKSKLIWSITWKVRYTLFYKHKAYKHIEADFNVKNKHIL